MKDWRFRAFVPVSQAGKTEPGCDVLLASGLRRAWQIFARAPLARHVSSSANRLALPSLPARLDFYGAQDVDVRRRIRSGRVGLIARVLAADA